MRVTTLIALVFLTVQSTQSAKPNQTPERSYIQIVFQENSPAQATSEPNNQSPPAAAILNAARKDKFKSAPENGNGTRPDEGPLIQRRLEVFTGFLVVVGFLQVIVLVWQGCIFRKTLMMIRLQARIYDRQRAQMIKAGEQTERIIMQAGDTAQKQLRAYVCIDTAMLTFKMGRPHEAQINIKNSGQTPAYELRQSVHTWIAEHPLKVTLPEPPEGFQMSKAILPPGGLSIMVAAGEPELRPDVAKQFGSAKYTFYVYGRVLYKDAFGRERYTNYRLFYGGSEGGRYEVLDHAVLRGLLKPDVDGNDAN